MPFKRVKSVEKLRWYYRKTEKKSGKNAILRKIRPCSRRCKASFYRKTTRRAFIFHQKKSFSNIRVKSEGVVATALWVGVEWTGCPRKTQNRKAGLPIQTPGSDDSIKSIARARASACSDRWRNYASLSWAEFENAFYIPDIEELPSFGGVLLLIKSFCFLYGLKVL